jgi:hypothetical protein
MLSTFDEIFRTLVLVRSWILLGVCHAWKDGQQEEKPHRAHDLKSFLFLECRGTGNNSDAYSWWHGVQHSGAVILLPVFGQPVAKRRRTRLEGVLAVFGEIRGGGPVWDVESGGTACVLVADCQWPQSRACLKPGTMRVTFEEFSPTHQLF